MSQTFSNTFPQFEARLNGSGTLGVAVSGGGDSVALLYALAEWGERPLHVFCVDHGLNPQSPEWTRSVADHAAKLGAAFTALHWTGDKPTTGLSAAARMARHLLLADAARENSIRVLCLGHTADDVAEAEAMRAEGSTVGTPAEWAPSPAWPQGRGIFLYRPFLEARRQALRDYLRTIDVTWIDDPANEHPASLRARVRAQQNGAGAVPANADAPPPSLPLVNTGWEAAGLLTFDAAALTALPPDQALRILSAAAVCAGGGDKLPRRTALEALVSRLPAGRALTLCGARLRQADGLIQVSRDAGDMARRPLPALAGVWDGRFAVADHDPGDIAAARGLRSRLPDADRTALLRLPEAVRDSLPILRKENDFKLLSVYAGYDDGSSCLVRTRFLAAVEAVGRESDL